MYIYMYVFMYVCTYRWAHWYMRPGPPEARNRCCSGRDKAPKYFSSWTKIVYMYVCMYVIRKTWRFRNVPYVWNSLVCGPVLLTLSDGSFNELVEVIVVRENDMSSLHTYMEKILLYRMTYSKFVIICWYHIKEKSLWGNISTGKPTSFSESINEQPIFLLQLI